jgi:molybdenum cofactor cytidylyltransferase
MKTINNIWAIVLAAGESKRMKKQKLLLPFKGKTMIESVIENIAPVLNDKILVVLGSHRYEIRQQIHKLPVVFCVNKNYKEGMLSSVISGFRALPGNAEAAIVFLGDQPQIPTGVIKKVVDSWLDTDNGIIIPVFNGKRGHPVMISMKYREDIENLDPKNGLRQLMDKKKKDIVEVECGRPEILRDIDTPEDYNKETGNTLLK